MNKKNSCGFRPLRSQCIVKILKEEETTKGGIIIAARGTREAEDRELGVLIAKGPDFNHDSRTEGEDVKEGDIVAFARYGGKFLKNEGHEVEYRIMRDIDLLAVQE